MTFDVSHRVIQEEKEGVPQGRCLRPRRSDGRVVVTRRRGENGEISDRWKKLRPLSAGRRATHVSGHWLLALSVPRGRIEHTFDSVRLERKPVEDEFQRCNLRPVAPGRSLTLAALFAGIEGIETGLARYGAHPELLCECWELRSSSKTDAMCAVSTTLRN